MARGAHTRLGQQPYLFARVDAASGDRVLVAPDASGELTLKVHGVFADGAQVRDAYSGRTATVQGGAVSLRADGGVLLEAAP